MYKPRTYRSWVKNNDLVSFEVIEKETDLFISASKDLTPQARELVLNCRKDIEGYIKRVPDFFNSLEPVKLSPGAPDIVREMILASNAAAVGPMASVAGATAEFVGKGLDAFTDQVVVENGGDIFIKTSKARIIGIFAGDKSPFTGKLAIEIPPCENGVGVCTSSGTVSHSLSFGKADAVTIISDNAALADAAATACANLVKGPPDMERAVERAKSILGVRGILVIIGNKLASWGSIKLV